MTSFDEYYALCDQAMVLPDGNARFEIRKRAALVADQLQDEEFIFHAQLQLGVDGVNSANFEEAFFAFTRFATIYDQDPIRFSSNRNLVLWFYGWSIAHICFYASVSKTQIEHTLASYKRRLQEDGSGLGAWWQSCVEVGIHTGEPFETLREKQAKCLETRHTVDDLCPACALNDDVELYAHLDDYDRLVDRALPALDGTVRCDSTPHITFSHVVLPAFVRDDPRAPSWFDRGYEIVKTEQRHISAINRHFDYVVASDQIELGIEMFQRHAGWAIDVRDDFDRLSFTVPSEVLFEKIRDRGTQNVELVLPETWQHLEPSGRYDVARLIEVLGEDRARTCDAFDLRNENDFISTRVADKQKMLGWA